MGLLNDYTFKGVTIQNAYFKISGPSQWKRAEDGQWFNKLDLDISVSQGSEVIDRIGYNMPWNLETPNTVREGYLYLKTLPEFADAIDLV